MRQPRGGGKVPPKVAPPPHSAPRPGGGGSTGAKGGHKKAPRPKPPPKPKKTPPRRKPRAWSPGSDVACCSAQALGTLLGWDWEDVLALYWRTAAGPDEGATIEDTMEAACVRRRLVRGPDADPGGTRAPLILGISLPEPHAVAVTPDGRWWSWGQPFDPAAWPGLTIDEAWAVTW